MQDPQLGCVARWAFTIERAMVTYERPSIAYKPPEGVSAPFLICTIPYTSLAQRILALISLSVTVVGVSAICRDIVVQWHKKEGALRDAVHWLATDVIPRTISFLSSGRP